MVLGKPRANRRTQNSSAEKTAKCDQADPNRTHASPRSKLLSCASWACRLLRLFRLGDDFQVALAYRFHEHRVVLFTLVGVSSRELCNGFVEGVALAEISADQRRLTRAGMRPCQREPAELRILEHVRQSKQLDHDFGLHIL